MSDDDRTVFMPPVGAPGAPEPPADKAASPSAAPDPFAPGTSIAGDLPGSDGPGRRREGHVRIQPGDVLNHIFEVKRFIAQGGMGEVFEGLNVTSDERVAIKVILPSLAADPQVQGMFRKEARTLTRLSHPALVQYRVMAQEPRLGVLYIVTEFIDGRNLADVLGEINPGEAELAGLLRRLAGGLRAAHALGAIHRDISPDNVLLEHGDVAKARIIDFGIAKDLDPGAKTIIGEGFGGKLGYVAPEQLGDFDREVGPWTDVYSLALVILAIAGGRGVDLGGSFVDAIDKRRKGVDVDAAPASLRPVLTAMLAPDPARRLRSMDAVLAALSGAPQAVAASPPANTQGRTDAIKGEPAEAKRAASAAKAGQPAPTGAKASISGVPMPAIAAGAAAAILLAGGAAWWLTNRSNGPAPAAAGSTGGQFAAPAAARGERGDVRAAVAAMLPRIGCSWLDLSNAQAAGGPGTLKLTGVAGHPAQAQALIAQAIKANGAAVASSDFSDVAPLSGSECGSVDAFRAIRASNGTYLTVPQHTFEMSRLGSDSMYAGQVGARLVINLDLTKVADFALYGLEPNGAISSLIPDRRTFDAMPKTGIPIADLGGSHYRFSIDGNHTGWSGILLLTGTGGFSDKLVVGPAASRGVDWPQRFAAAAAKGRWKAEMVWFRTVDEIPN